MRTSRRGWLSPPLVPAVVSGAGATLLALGWAGPARAQEPGNERPNVVVVLVDDLRFDEYGAAGHPFLETPAIDRMAREGVSFTRDYHVTPLCSPNRASLLTGQYPSRHGIRDNVAKDLTSHRLRTFPAEVQALGYRTGFIGKWHMGNDPTPRPGFDTWVALPGQGRTIDPQLYEDGSLRTVEGYVTDLLTDRAVDFIRAGTDRPFLLYLSHKAVHPDARQLDDGSVDPDYPSRFIPAPRHEGRYENAEVLFAPSYLSGRALPEGKPAIRSALRHKWERPETDAARMLAERPRDIVARTRAEMLLSVDESLGRLLSTLEELGILDRTLVVFTSDNGYWYGEHGLTAERRLPYEAGVRSPLLIRYPPLARPGSTVDALALSVDLAPTVIEAAGGTPPARMQGRSLLPLLRGDTAGWRTAAMLEYFSHERPFAWMLDMSYKAVVTDRYKLIHWLEQDDADELYDLQGDPYEMTNLIDDPDHAETVRTLRAELARLVGEVIL